MSTNDNEICWLLRVVGIPYKYYTDVDGRPHWTDKVNVASRYGTNTLAQIRAQSLARLGKQSNHVAVPFRRVSTLTELTPTFEDREPTT